MGLVWSLLIGMLIGFTATFFQRRSDTIQLCAMVIAGVFGGMLGEMLAGQLSVISPAIDLIAVIGSALLIVLIISFSFSRKEYVK